MMRGKIGCEIEHGSELSISEWRDFFIKKGWRGWAAVGDGSVRVSDGCAIEITSAPSEVTDAGIAQLFEKVRDIYGNMSEINKTCGLHFHLSFRNKADYWRLCSWDFVSKFQAAYLERFRADYEQDRKDNDFCKFWNEGSMGEFIRIVGMQLSAKEKSGHRYHSVNFNAVNLYTTIEFRVFPGARTFGKFREYMTFLLRFVSHYLRTCRDQIEEVREESKTEGRKKIVLIQESVTLKSLRGISTVDLKDSALLERRPGLSHLFEVEPQRFDENGEPIEESVEVDA